MWQRCPPSLARPSAVGAGYHRDVAPDDDDGDSLSPGQWMVLVAGRHRLLVISLAAHALLLIVLPRLWSVQIEGHSRSGRAFFMSAAARDLWLAGVGVALYLGAGVGGARHWAMRPPSDAEISVARWLVRAIGLVTLWVAFVVTFRAVP
jgi:hypothetical protein